MKTKSNQMVAALATVLALSIVACGKKESINETDPSSDPGQNVLPSPGPGTPPPTGGGPTFPPEAPNLTFTGNFSGPNGSWISPSFTTDSKLRVRIKPNGAIPVTGTGFSPTHYCISYRISIVGVGSGSTTRTIAINGGNQHCYGAPANDEIDLSGLLNSGHNAVRIKISEARYDFRSLDCENHFYRYGASYMNPYYSAYTPNSGACMRYNNILLYDTHSANFDVGIIKNSNVY
jgi:hypothetical protein